MENNNLITVYVNGVFCTSLEDREDKSIYIYEIGEKFLIKQNLYNKFVDDLELNGFDCYLCPDIYSHPEWNGTIKFINN
jgi:hypothetical protein